MFRAIKQHATGTYHGKQRHGKLLLKAINKTPFQRSTEKMVASMQTWQMISRHVCDLVHITTEHYITRQGDQQ